MFSRAAWTSHRRRPMSLSWLPSVSRGGWERCSGLGRGGSRKWLLRRVGMGMRAGRAGLCSRTPVSSRARHRANGIGDRVSVGDVGQPALEAAHGLHRRPARCLLPVVVGASFGRVAQLDGRQPAGGSSAEPLLKQAGRGLTGEHRTGVGGSGRRKGCADLARSPCRRPSQATSPSVDSETTSAPSMRLATGSPPVCICAAMRHSRAQLSSPTCARLVVDRKHWYVAGRAVQGQDRLDGRSS